MDVVQELLAVQTPHPAWQATTQLFALVVQVAHIVWLQVPIVPPEIIKNPG